MKTESSPWTNLKEDVSGTIVYFVDAAPGPNMKLVLSEHVTFLNRAAIMRALEAIPAGAKVTIDASRTVDIDRDVYELIQSFAQRAQLRGIELTLLGFSTLRRESGGMLRPPQLPSLRGELTSSEGPAPRAAA